MHRRFVFAALLSGAALLIAAESAQAQIGFGFGRGGGWRGGGSSWYVDTPYASYGRGYYSPYGGYGYGRGWGGPMYGWGSGYYPYRSGFGISVGSPGFYSSPTYGYSYPSYSVSYPSSSFSFPTQTVFRSSQPYGMGSGVTTAGYETGMGQPSENRALVHLSVPAPDAEVWFEGEKTQQMGFRRAYISPELDPGQRYTYHVKARWMEDGREVVREKDIHVRAGRETPVAFGERSAEELRTAGYRDGQPIDRADDAQRRTDRERGEVRTQENEPLRDRANDPTRPRDPAQPDSRPEPGRSADPINKVNNNNNPPPPE